MGIRIAFGTAAALMARCDIASATTAIATPGTEDEAIVPSCAWRPLPTVDAQLLRATRDDDPAMIIEVIRPLPGWAPQLGKSLGRQISALDPFGGHHAAEFLAFTDSQPGLSTTTIDESVGLRIGLHLDNFDRLALAGRTASRRRLGLNLGPGARHLLLATIDIRDICQAAGIRRPSHCPHTDDVRRHVIDGRPLRLLRLRLDPGDGYIASTEFIPHDGSTLTAREPSRIAFWLGHWPVGSINSLI